MHIVKSILIYLLALNMLVSTLAVPLIYMDFNMRQDFIAKVLCVNRTKPITQCNGKCYLVKRLEAAQQTQEEDRQAVVIETAPSFFAYEIESSIFENRPSILQLDFFIYQSEQITSALLKSVFKPPRF